MDVITIETPSLGDRSYVVHDGRFAAVIDPQRDLDRLLAEIERAGVEVVVVAETHIHNDYVSGGRDLADRTGARYLVAAGDDVAFERVAVEDGDEFEVGTLRLRAVHTPGHTDTHLSWVVVEDGVDRAVCTGGSMLFGSVGRTDLLPDADPEVMTRHQYRSVNGLADALPGPAQVLPTHGFGSFCSTGDVVERTESTIDDERQDNDALVAESEDQFVEDLLAGLDAWPAYYRHMAPRNRAGAEAADLTPAPDVEAEEVARRIDAGEWVVDLRPRTDHAEHHVRGTVSIEYSDQATTYLGWLVPWGTPVTLLADDRETVSSMQRDLVRIGIDRPAGQVVGVSGLLSSLPTGSTRRVDFPALHKAREGQDAPLVLDVRQSGEFSNGHLDGVLHIPLHELPDRLDEVPTGRDVWVHCESGFRASIAASLLVRSGRVAVHIDDAFANAEELFELEA